MTISMPHRYCVRVVDESRTLEFDVEPLDGGILFYSSDPKLVSGTDGGDDAAADQVLEWLRSKFSHVEVDTSAKPAF
jgi:hypothetical protein